MLSMTNSNLQKFLSWKFGARSRLQHLLKSVPAHANPKQWNCYVIFTNLLIIFKNNEKYSNLWKNGFAILERHAKTLATHLMMGRPQIAPVKWLTSSSLHCKAPLPYAFNPEFTYIQNLYWVLSSTPPSSSHLCGFNINIYSFIVTCTLRKSREAYKGTVCDTPVGTNQIYIFLSLCSAKLQTIH